MWCVLRLRNINCAGGGVGVLSLASLTGLRSPATHRQEIGPAQRAKIKKYFKAGSRVGGAFGVTSYRHDSMARARDVQIHTKLRQVMLRPACLLHKGPAYSPLSVLGPRLQRGAGVEVLQGSTQGLGNRFPYFCPGRPRAVRLRSWTEEGAVPAVPHDWSVTQGCQGIFLASKSDPGMRTVYWACECFELCKGFDSSKQPQHQP